MEKTKVQGGCNANGKGHRAKVAIIGVGITLVIVLICLFSLRACAYDKTPASTDNQAAGALGETSSTVVPSQNAGVASTDSSRAADSTALGAADQGFSGEQPNDSAAAGFDGGTAHPSSPSRPSPEESSSSNGGDSGSAPSKTWVVDYSQIWVEDSPAWTEQVPVYGNEEQSVCNICGQVITGNETAHGKAHMMAGEGSGHHTEYVQVVTGSQTIHHDATGHYETVEAGGHWE